MGSLAEEIPSVRELKERFAVILRKCAIPLQKKSQVLGN